MIVRLATVHKNVRSTLDCGVELPQSEVLRTAKQ
jgi:hypothetical protein